MITIWLFLFLYKIIFLLYIHTSNIYVDVMGYLGFLYAHRKLGVALIIVSLGIKFFYSTHMRFI